MKLNDPFGRLAAREARDYEAVRKQLRGAGISSVADCEALAARLARQGRILSVAVAAAALVALLLWPDAAIVTLPIGALILLWISHTSRRSQTFIRRYMNEELKPENPAE